MNKNSKIIICGIIAAVIVSLLYAVVPMTNAFIISHIFSLIAIGVICGSLCVYGKGKSKAVAGISYIHSTALYGVISIIFSIIACLIPLSAIWTFVIHIAILGVFAIRIISSNIGSDYINKVDEKTEKKHNEFLKEKENYWK